MSGVPESVDAVKLIDYLKAQIGGTAVDIAALRVQLDVVTAENAQMRDALSRVQPPQQ